MGKKILIGLMFLTIMLCGCSAKKEEPQDVLTQIMKKDKITVGVKTDTPPFGYLDKDGKNIGFDIDLARYIAGKLLHDENKVEFVSVTPTDRIMKLSSGNVDMIVATMSITPNRQAVVDFSIPYHTAGQAILVKKNSNVTTLMDLRGKKVIIVFGSTVEANLRSNVPNISIIGYKTYPEAFKALKEGKADAMIADDTILFGFALSDNSVKILPKRYSKEPYGIAVRQEESSSELLKTINIELQEALNRGTLRQMQAKWGIN